jgi:ribonucleoside-diphosphate reductase alpha chain
MSQKQEAKPISVKKRSGKLEKLNVDKINAVVSRACVGIADVSASEIVLDAHLNLFDKISTKDIHRELVLTARSKIEKDPNYSYVAAKLLLNSLYKEVFDEGADSDVFRLQYHKSFISNLKLLIKNNILDSRLLDFNLKVINRVLEPSRDNLLKYHGAQILYDRYLIQYNGARMETPQAFFMRVAMGLCYNEKEKEKVAIEIYHAISQLYFMPATPTLFNSGTRHSQLSSCDLVTVGDSIDSIFETLHQEARKSKYSYGLGVDFSSVRATGSHIKGTNGSSSGIVPWLKIYNDTMVAVDQAGKRPGAMCIYLSPWHLDFEEFCDLRKTTGEERRRTHDLNLAAWCPDIFFEKIKKDEDWYMFCPSETGSLNETYGEKFNEEYNKYILLANKNEIRHRIIKAKDLWKKILKNLFENGYPWITFKDPSNARYMNKHCGIVRSSNLCTEILGHTHVSQYNPEGAKIGYGESFNCNLLAINLTQFVNRGDAANPIRWGILDHSIQLAIRALDNAIDINYYPTQEGKKSNLANRPIGLGVMGFHDVCHMLDIVYDSDDGIRLASEIAENIAFSSICASGALAKERGCYENYPNSEWSNGKLPFEVGIKDEIHHFSFGKHRWETARQIIATNGIRNCQVNCIQPTATISYICGVEQSIEPNYSVLFVYENKSGNFYIINEHFVNDMKKEGLWSPALSEAIKAVDGDINRLENIPQKYKDKYKTAFDRNMFKLIDATKARQQWIDTGISMNLYNKGSSLKELSDMYMYCYDSGLKTTYYLRNTVASRVEKSTVNIPVSQELNKLPAFCSINDPGCESCQ